MFNRFKSSKQFFVETRMGIVTQTGDWFHTTRKQIESFAPGLLAKVPLEELIKEAQAWVSSAGSLSLIWLYVLLFWVNPFFAGALTLVFHWVWYHYKSAFVVRGVGTILRIVGSDIFLFIIAFFSLTLLGFRHQYMATGVGIVFFFLMKPGLLKKGWDKISKTVAGQLTLNDRVLKMIIIKRSMVEGTTPANIEKMEERLRELAFSRKKGNK